MFRDMDKNGETTQTNSSETKDLWLRFHNLEPVTE